LLARHRPEQPAGGSGHPGGRRGRRESRAVAGAASPAPSRAPALASSRARWPAAGRPSSPGRPGPVDLAAWLVLGASAGETRL